MFAPSTSTHIDEYIDRSQLSWLSCGSPRYFAHAVPRNLKENRTEEASWVGGTEQKINFLLFGNPFIELVVFN